MASIDKIYGTKEQYWQFYNWCEDQIGTWFFYDEPLGENGPITNTPVWVDVWLWKNCPFEFVKMRLLDMYGDKAPKIKKNDVYFMNNKHNYKEKYWMILDLGFEYYVKPNQKYIWKIDNRQTEKTLLTIYDLSE